MEVTALIKLRHKHKLITVNTAVSTYFQARNLMLLRITNMSVLQSMIKIDLKRKY